MLFTVRPGSGDGPPPLLLQLAQWRIDGLEEILDRAVFGRDDVGPGLRDGGGEGLPEADGFVRGGRCSRFRERPGTEDGPQPPLRDAVASWRTRPTWCQAPAASVTTIALRLSRDGLGTISALRPHAGGWMERPTRKRAGSRTPEAPKPRTHPPDHQLGQIWAGLPPWGTILCRQAAGCCPASWGHRATTRGPGAGGRS